MRVHALSSTHGRDFISIQILFNQNHLLYEEEGLFLYYAICAYLSAARVESSPCHAIAPCSTGSECTLQLIYA